MAATSPTVSPAARSEVRPWADKYDASSGLQCYVLSFLGLAPALEDVVTARRHAKFLAPPKSSSSSTPAGRPEARLATIFAIFRYFCYNKYDTSAFDFDFAPKNTTRNRAP